jgi:hypothetical protein
VIPCYLSIHSKNTDALDTLANHEYLRVCLVRRIHLHEDPKQAYSRTQEVQNANGDKVPPGVIERIDIIERAVWWPISSSEEPDTRYLQGEIHLKKELQPSSQFLLFKVSVSIFSSFVFHVLFFFLTRNGCDFFLLFFSSIPSSFILLNLVFSSAPTLDLTLIALREILKLS